MPFAEFDGIRLFYTDDGAVAPTILLVHGWACDSNDWAWQIPAFQGRHRVIAPDLRGHGRSVAPTGGYRPRQFAEDLAQLLRRLDCGPAVVIGHSMGAVVGAMLAVEHPELVMAMISVDPSYGVSVEEFPERLEFLGAVRGPDGVTMGATAIRDWAVDATPSGLTSWHVRRALGMDHEVLSECLTALFAAPDQICRRPQSEEYLSRRECPVLAIHATTSSATWEKSTFRHALSRSIGWDGSGHWLQLERPAEFNAVVLQWIAEVSEGLTA